MDIFGLFGSLFQTIFGGLMGMGINEMNNQAAAEREQVARKENYAFGEMAANNADTRTRNLYTDLYSPQAQMSQIKDAGLSPSLYYGGAGGISGQTGAQGTGAAGVSPNVFGVDPMVGAQMSRVLAETANIKANTEKTKAETENVNEDTHLKQIESNINELKKNQFADEYAVMNMIFYDSEGNTSSAYEIANGCHSVYDFLKTIREIAQNQGGSGLESRLTTEASTRILRNIYMNAKQNDADIKILSDKSVSAEFHEQVTKVLKESDYAEMNAKALVGKMRQQVQDSLLSEQQKTAWNNLLKRLEDAKGNTAKDIALVFAMIADRALTSYH